MKGFSIPDNDEFKSEILESRPLDKAIDWIIAKYGPADLFEESALEEWALDNGFVKNI